MAILGSLRERFKGRGTVEAESFPRSSSPPEYQEESTERPSMRERFGGAKARVESVRDRYAYKKKMKEAESDVERTKRAIDNRIEYKATERRYQQSAIRKKIAQHKIEAREMERDARRAEFVAKHPYVEKSFKAGGRAKERAKNVAVRSAEAGAIRYAEVTGRTYVTGQQLATRAKSKGFKTKEGKTTTMTPFTPTPSNIVAPTPPTSTLMGSTTGLGQMIQTGGAIQQQQTVQRDYLGELKYGLGQPKQVDYFGGKKLTLGSTKKTTMATGLGLGLSSKKIDYFGGGSKKTGILKTTKQKKNRYY